MQKIIIAKGNSRKDTKWARLDTTFEELIEMLRTPIKTNETFSEYLSMSKEAQDSVKDVGGYIGAVLKNGSRKKENILTRTLVSLDADYIKDEGELKSLIDKLRRLGLRFFIHSTKKHTKERPRVRILMPLSEPIEAAAYEPLARHLCFRLGMDLFDPTTVQINRFMYWPSVSFDMDDQYLVIRGDNEAPSLDGIKYLAAAYTDWRDQRSWPTFPGESDKVEREAKVQEDPLSKEGIVGAFCRAYFPIDKAIEKFLAGVYEKTDGHDDRYTYLGGSTYGGALVFDDRFIYSYHATDPASGILCNAFDLVRIHKFGDKKKSIKEMMEFAAKDSEATEQVAKEDFERALSSLDESGIDESDKTVLADIFRRLKRDDKGNIVSSITNIKLILDSDPRLKNFYYNEFEDAPIVEGPLPWNESSEERLWSDRDDSGLIAFLEDNNYNITGDRKVIHALNLVFTDRGRHPVRDYLNTLEWDGKRRLESLFVDYFGAEDAPYTRDITRKSFAALVSRIYKPGTKFDTMVVLIGKQGQGKTTFFQKMAKDKWYTSNITDFSGKDAMDGLNGNWIVELEEMAAIVNKKTDLDLIKGFISRTSDEYRSAYAKRKERHPRQCVFFGTTNRSEFLRDTTGNRRFWPLQLGVTRPTKDVFVDLTDEEVNQIFAEAKYYYELGESLILKGESAKQAVIEQENRLIEDPWKAKIIEFLLTPIPPDWYERSVDEHILYMDDVERNGPPSNAFRRNVISIREISLVCLGMNERDCDQLVSRKVSEALETITGIERTGKIRRFTKNYGRQRTYIISPEFFEIYDN